MKINISGILHHKKNIGNFTNEINGLKEELKNLSGRRFRLNPIGFNHYIKRKALERCA